MNVHRKPTPIFSLSHHKNIFVKDASKNTVKTYVNYISFKNYYLQFFLVFSLEKKAIEIRAIDCIYSWSRQAVNFEL